jgi:hypothetical protein
MISRGALLSGLLLCAGCVDLERYRPLDDLLLAPIEQLVSVTHDPSTPANDPLRPFVLADVDGDGAEDLAYVNLDGSLSIHRAGPRPGSSFSAEASQSGPGPVSYDRLLARDLDGDGAAEIIAAGVTAWRWDRASGQPVGLTAFSPRADVDSYAAFDGPGAAAALWYVFGSPSPSTVHAVRWAGEQFVEVASAPGGRGAPLSSVQAADLDGDGQIDIVEGPDDDAGTRLLVFWGGLAGIAQPQTIGCGSGVYADYLDDVDGDGQVDLVVLNNSQQLLWCPGRGRQGLGDPTLLTAVGDNVLLSFADLDRDRRPDLLILEGSWDSPRLRLLRNIAGGFVPMGETAQLPGYHSTTGVHATQITAQDLDADGKLDVVLWAYDGLFWLRNLSK